MGDTGNGDHAIALDSGSSWTAIAEDDFGCGGAIAGVGGVHSGHTCREIHGSDCGSMEIIQRAG